MLQDLLGELSIDRCSLKLELILQGWIWPLHSFCSQRQPLVSFQRLNCAGHRPRDRPQKQGLHPILHSKRIEKAQGTLKNKDYVQSRRSTHNSTGKHQKHIVHILLSNDAQVTGRRATGSRYYKEYLKMFHHDFLWFDCLLTTTTAVTIVGLFFCNKSVTLIQRHKT